LTKKRRSANCSTTVSWFENVRQEHAGSNRPCRVALGQLGPAQSPDISARRLLSAWKSEESMLAEVISSAFASGFSWGGDAAGKQVYCASPDLKGREIMIAFEGFLRVNLKTAGPTESPMERRGVSLRRTIKAR
jgi:hypothetical protein